MPKPEFKKRDALDFALDELKYAESRLRTADQRIDGIWNDFIVARRDRATAQTDVKRAMQKLSKVAAKAMLSKFRTPDSVAAVPNRLSFPGPDPIKKKLKPLPGMSNIMHHNELREVRAANAKKQTADLLEHFNIEILEDPEGEPS